MAASATSLTLRDSSAGVLSQRETLGLRSLTLPFSKAAKLPSLQSVSSVSLQRLLTNHRNLQQPMITKVSNKLLSQIRNTHSKKCRHHRWRVDLASLGDSSALVTKTLKVWAQKLRSGSLGTPRNVERLTLTRMSQFLKLPALRKPSSLIVWWSSVLEPHRSNLCRTCTAPA